MKLRQSLAKQDWRVAEASALSVRFPDYRFEILSAVDGGERWECIGTAIDRERAVAISALPKLYAVCLEVMKADASSQFNSDLTVMIEAWKHIVNLSRDALDAANDSDEVRK